MISDKNFKLSKTAKRMLALMRFKDKHDRGSFKRLMIEAEVTYARAKHANAKSKGSKDLD